MASHMRRLAFAATCMAMFPAVAAAQSCEEHFGVPADPDYIAKLVPSEAEQPCRAELEASPDDPARQFRFGYILVELDRADGSAQRGMALIGKAAHSGFGPAQSAMGYYSSIGKHLPKDEPEAFRWFSLAAENGHPGAFPNLGWMYYTGTVVAQDFTKAAQYILPGAEAGRSFAMAMAGHMYLNGQGVEKDVKKGFEYVARAATAGDVWSQSHLGTMLENGTATAPDKALALGWYRKAAEKGDAFAAERIKVLEAEALAAEQSTGITGTQIAIGAAALAILLLMASDSGSETQEASSSGGGYQPPPAPENPWKDSCWLMTDMEAAFAGC